MFTWAVSRTRVRVEPLGKVENVGRAGEDDPVFRISDLAVDTGLADLASSVDHDLYGHPKADDGKSSVSGYRHRQHESS